MFLVKHFKDTSFTKNWLQLLFLYNSWFFHYFQCIESPSILLPSKNYSWKSTSANYFNLFKVFFAYFSNNGFFSHFYRRIKMMELLAKWAIKKSPSFKTSRVLYKVYSKDWSLPVILSEPIIKRLSLVWSFQCYYKFPRVLLNDWVSSRIHLTTIVLLLSLTLYFDII